MDNEIFRRIFEFSEGGAYMNLYLFGGALSDFHVMDAAHVVHDVVGKVVAGHLYTFVRDDASERNHGNLRSTSAYIHNHIALRREHVDTDTEGGSHRLINHVDVASAGMFARVAHGADLDLGRARGDADHHAERGGEPAAFRAYHLHHAADHLLGGVEVGDHSVAERTDRADAGRLLAFHLMCHRADGQ